MELDISLKFMTEILKSASSSDEPLGTLCLDVYKTSANRLTHRLGAELPTASVAAHLRWGDLATSNCADCVSPCTLRWLDDGPRAQLVASDAVQAFTKDLRVELFCLFFPR